MMDLPVFYRRDEVFVQFDYIRKIWIINGPGIQCCHGDTEFSVLLCVSVAKSQVDKLSDDSHAILLLTRH